MSITTEFTQLLKIQHPVLLAGMGPVSGAPLAAAVSNAGGLGVVGGFGFTVPQLKEILDQLKANLRDPSLPFGVDLLFPQVGGSARKTNKDYNAGRLEGLIDLVIESGAKLFVCAVGVPPKWVVEKLHGAGILYMNMVGHPKHVRKALDLGCDIICAQGGEAGGHTGYIPFSVLIPACADICKQYTSPITGKPVMLVAAGGVSGGRSLAASLMLGASAVWVGTRFLPAKESGASAVAKKNVVDAGFDSTILTTIFTGRPLRVQTSPYIEEWETARKEELKALQDKGILAWEHDMDKLEKEGKLTEEIEDQSIPRPMGYVAGLINKGGQTAGEIVQEIMNEAYEVLSKAKTYVEPAKL